MAVPSELVRTRPDIRAAEARLHAASAAQDHRNVKSRANAMLAFKRFRNAAITLAGTELTHRMRKGQFRLNRLRLNDTITPAVWNAVIVAQ
jgi:transposase-like protein